MSHLAQMTVKITFAIKKMELARKVVILENLALIVRTIVLLSV